MAAKRIWRWDVGSSGFKPGRVLIDAGTSTFSAVTTAGFITKEEQQVWSLQSSDFVDILYGSSNASLGQFQPSISAGVVTLNSLSGTVSGSTTAGNFAAFSDSVGGLKDLGYLPSNAALLRVVMANLTGITSGNITKFNDTTGTLIDGGLAANVILSSSITTPDTNANIVSFSVSCGQAALAAAGSVTLYTSSGSKRYRINTLYLNTGTNFSGGGGDRLGSVTDGTTSFSSVPAATMQTLTNSTWGATALTIATTPTTSIAAGASLLFKYSGGTADYTAGALTICGTLIRTA